MLRRLPRRIAATWHRSYLLRDIWWIVDVKRRQFLNREQHGNDHHAAEPVSFADKLGYCGTDVKLFAIGYFLVGLDDLVIGDLDTATGPETLRNSLDRMTRPTNGTSERWVTTSGIDEL